MVDAATLHVTGAQLTIIVALITLVGPITAAFLTVRTTRVIANDNRELQERIASDQRRLAEEERLFERRSFMSEQVLEAASLLASSLLMTTHSLTYDSAIEYIEGIQLANDKLSGMTGLVRLYAPQDVIDQFLKLRILGYEENHHLRMLKIDGDLNWREVRNRLKDATDKVEDEMADLRTALRELMHVPPVGTS